jgi:6-pyruvoyltetrahydropterin/6-carboxytetrahydropterin synthase
MFAHWSLPERSIRRSVRSPLLPGNQRCDRPHNLRLLDNRLFISRPSGTIQVQDQRWEIMFEVTVEDTFAAGHYLRNYKGKCENPHGHNYKIRVTLAGVELDKAGLLLDFKDLREVMKHVIERLDHQMINDIEPFTEINPSAENLAKYFYDESNTRLQTVTRGRVRVKDVTVFETDTTTAKYSE